MCSVSPISATLVAWGNAWLLGHVGLDEAADRLERVAGPQLVRPTGTGLRPDENGGAGPGDADLGAACEVPLRRYLADLRVAGLRELRLALPVAGDPLGLTGPPDFNGHAVDAGQAAIAVLPGRCVGLVPERVRRGSSYAGVRWAALDAAPTPPDLPSLGEAERALTEAMRDATEALAGIGGPAPERPSIKPFDDGLAPGYPPRAHRVAALCNRLAAALRAADDRGLTSGQIATRSQVLRELDRAVRRARIASHHAIGERP